MRTEHGRGSVSTSRRLLRRLSGVVAAWTEGLSRGGGRLGVPAPGGQPLAAPAAAEQAAASEPVLPDELTLGQGFSLPEGLELTVTGIGRLNSDPRHVVMDVRVANTSDHKAEFENDFGVLDAEGTAHRYSWVNSGTYPGVLPGVATLEPEAVLAGTVHVLLPERSPETLATLRPAFLGAINAGCGGCNHQVVLLPRALWQASKLSPPRSVETATAAPR